LFSASIPVYSAALSMGYGEQDTASVCGVLQTMAGVKRGRPGKRSKRHWISAPRISKRLAARRLCEILD
jgi:hypothetical protein